MQKIGNDKFTWNVSFLSLILHPIIPYQIGNIIPSQKDYYFAYFFGVFDVSGNFFPVLDTYLHYALYLATIFAPAMIFATVTVDYWIKTSFDFIISFLRFTWLLYTTIMFTAEISNSNYRSVFLLSYKTWSILLLVARQFYLQFEIQKAKRKIK